MGATAWVFLLDGFEEIEAVTPIDLLRRAGVAVTTLACGEGPTRWVRGRSGIVLKADARLADWLEERREELPGLLVVPGGPAVSQGLRQHLEVRRLLRAQVAAGRLVGAICAAPLVLLDAGLLGAGCHYTAHPTALGELAVVGGPTAGAVVQDGWLVTSPGAGTALAFSLALVEALVGRSAALAVAESIASPLV